MKDLQTILKQEPVYMHEWKTRMDVIRDFENIPLLATDHENALLWIMTHGDLSKGNSQMITALERWMGVNILFASYGLYSYEGYAFVLFEREGKLYEVNGYHCSCYGLEQQFEPQETVLESLSYRLTQGKLGFEWNKEVFANRLKWFLGIPTE
jgi:hypothetical protein